MNRILLVFLLSLSCAGCATSENLLISAPSSLPGVECAMKRPGFWISRHPSPDKVVLDSRQIGEFNLRLQNTLKLTEDLKKFALPIAGDKFSSSQSAVLGKLKLEGLYRANCEKAQGSFYGPIEHNINLIAVPDEIRPRFGFIVSFANQRILPTNDGLYGKPNDIDFDELQNSGLDIGTPVAVLYNSLDNKWCYVQSPLSAGWVEAGRIAFCELKEIEALSREHKPAVVIDAKADIYLDPDLREYYGYVRMGTALPLNENINSRISEVIVPMREESGTAAFKKCYVRKESVNEGYLPYTACNIIRQAFELLNEPYGWGDMRGEQDCSSFVQRVFATTGICLPRNPAAQLKSGLLIAEFDKSVCDKEKMKILKGKAIGGLTLLYLKGHIMLFLGMADDMPYAIHATWAYRENIAGHDTVRLVNRVAVTDLSLGKGSGKGSLLERLAGITIVSD